MKLFRAIPAVCIALAAPSVAQTEKLIGLDVQVIDTRTGDIPELLGPNDFEVYVDGQRTSIRKLDIESPPLDVVFVIYMSNPGLSTPLERQRFTGGLRAAAGALRPEDRAGVVRGPGPRGVTLALTADSSAVTRGLSGGVAQPEKERLFDAAASALSLFPKQASLVRRRAIIAITDDIERHSETKADGLQEDLLTAGVTLHEVMLALTRAGSRVNVGGPQLPIPQITGVVGRRGSSGGGSLVGIVRATGGETLIGDDFDEVLPGLLRHLRLRYTLTVAVPAGLKAFHKTEVGLSPAKRLQFPNVTVRTRIGYYSAP